LDIVQFIHQHLKQNNITDDQAAKLQVEELVNKGKVNSTTVGQVAGTNTRANYYIFEGRAPTRAVLDRMCTSNLHRIPIVDGDGQLYGICSQTDIINFVYRHKNLIAEQWNKTIEELQFGLHEVFTIKTSDILMKAFDLIEEKEISGVGVLDDNGALVGTISGSDIKVIGSGVENLHKLFLPYKDVITNPRPLIYVTKSDTFGTLLEKFVNEKLHRTFIINPNTKAPLGIISLVDLLKKIQASF